MNGTPWRDSHCAGYQHYKTWCGDNTRKPFSKGRVKELLEHNVGLGITLAVLNGHEIFRGVQLKRDEDGDDHAELASALGGRAQVDGSAQGNPASMLRIQYDAPGHQGLKEGSWYDVDPRAFAGFQYQLVERDAPGSSLVRVRLVGNRPDLGTFARLITPRVANVPIAPLELVVDPNPKGDVELTVVDCGHGNWNEIRTATDRVIYDVGASRWFTKAQVRHVVTGRSIVSETRPISVVISHWDVDHYHALLEFEPAELAKLRVVIIPCQVPDTETYRRVHDRLTSHGVALAAQQPAPSSGASKKISLEKHWQSGIFTMFRGTPGRSRNQTGIVLGVQGSHEVALLTGDHHYDKVLAAAKGSGTDRSFFDFEFDAGMRHTRLSRSICAQVACSASFRRHPVLRRNRAIRPTMRLSSVRRTFRRPASSSSLG